ncbi:hypothetical protein QE405_003993 [Nocardioides zeae]|uniref:Uncharacterized protein n=1 Tax=Nocardioides zeae TaxID=1457234 RepID=A0AAJ1U3L0_9ACTN|nr:hypothetical protein [Nocardioides zeae]
MCGWGGSGRAGPAPAAHFGPPVGVSRVAPVGRVARCAVGVGLVEPGLPQLHISGRRWGCRGRRPVGRVAKCAVGVGLVEPGLPQLHISGPPVGVSRVAPRWPGREMCGWGGSGRAGPAPVAHFPARRWGCRGWPPVGRVARCAVGVGLVGPGLLQLHISGPPVGRASGARPTPRACRRWSDRQPGRQPGRRADLPSHPPGHPRVARWSAVPSGHSARPARRGSRRWYATAATTPAPAAGRGRVRPLRRAPAPAAATAPRGRRA